MEPGLATLGRVARAMSDPRLGILKYFGEAPNLPVAPSLFIATAETIDGIYFQDFDDTARAEGVHTSGAGLTREECMWATLGESMERYAARCCTVDLVTAAAQDVEADAIDVTKIIRFSDAQYDSEGFFYSRFDRDASRRWVWSTDLVSGARKLVPAQIIWLGLRAGSRAEALFQPNSSGLAAGGSVEHARCSGLLEIVERDAFMTTWLLRRSPPRIKVDDNLLAELDPKLHPLIAHPDLETLVLDITTDLGIPTVMAMVTPPSKAFTTVGAAAHLYLRTAIRKAVIEAHHSFAWSVGLRGAPMPERHEVENFQDHSRFYHRAESQVLLDFLREGPSRAAVFAEIPADRPGQLREILNRLTAKGYGAYHVDMTTEDAAQLGFSVGRALIPGLHPLSAGVQNYALDRRRLEVVARHWGHAVPETLNTDPHPFP